MSGVSCRSEVLPERLAGGVLLKYRLECRTRAVKVCKAALRLLGSIPRTVLRSGTCGGAAPNVVRSCRASMVVFPSVVVELRVLPVIPRL